jgi:putative peptidoglycan lipid II flippase
MSITVPPKANHQVARAAGTVMFAFLISQIIGLIAKILIGGTFPAGVDLDAFFAANRPSETLNTIIAGGILVSSFIPVFVNFLVKGDRDSAWRLASATCNLILVIMILLAILEILFAEPIVKYILGVGFSPAKQILTITLLRIQAGSIILFGVSGVLIGILNSHQKFLLSALTPAMYQLGLIFGVLFLSPKMGIYGLAWGVVIGSGLYLLIQLPSLFPLRWKYSFTFGFRNPAVGEVFRLMAPRMFGAAVVQLMLWVNTMLASNMAEGSVYSLSLGFTIMLMAEVAIGQSIATASMPTFSAQYAQGKLDEIRSTLSSTLRGVILLSLPAAFGLILLRVPIIALLFQRGAFSVETTRMVSWALAWYATGLVFHSTLEILVRAFYAMHDTKTPVIVGASAMTLSIGLSLLFAHLFNILNWLPLGGLALAVSVSTFLEVTILFIILRKRLRGIQDSRIIKVSLLSIIGCTFMTLGLVFWIKLSGDYPLVIQALGGVILGGVIYGLTLYTLRVNELRSLFYTIKNRLIK